MTTHEAAAMQPNTPVQWLPPRGPVTQSLRGAASLLTPVMLVIKWDAIGEPDSNLNVTDRRMLAAIKILDPKQEGNL